MTLIVEPTGLPDPLKLFPDTERPRRWVTEKKLAVLRALEQASFEAAEVIMHAYELSSEEVAIWRAAMDKHGKSGLRVTRIGVSRVA